MHRADIVNLYDNLSAEERAGVVWTLKQSGDLNVNLVRFPAGGGVDEHVNKKVDVLIMGVSGSGVITVDEQEYRLQAGTLAFLPKGACRSTSSGSEDFAYLTVHRRLGPLQIGGLPASG